MKVKPREVLEIHICTEPDGSIQTSLIGVTTLTKFIREWSHCADWNIGDWINSDCPWFGIVHDDGAYLINANHSDTRAALLASMAEADAGGNR